jgi:hypothetical protein
MSKKRKKAKGLIPKKIAGVKVPKAVRQGRFGELLASKAGQALIAQAVLGAGAVAAGVKAKDDPKVRQAAHDTKHKLKDLGADATQGAGLATSTIAYALGEAARSFADAIRHGERRASGPDDDADTAWTPDYGAPEASSAGANGDSRKKQSKAQGAAPR